MLGINLDFNLINNSSNEQIVKYISILKNYGVTNFDIFSSDIFDNTNKMIFIIKLFKQLNLTLSIHMAKDYLNLKNDNDITKCLINIQKDIYKLRKILDLCGFTNFINLNFHCGKYNNKKQEQIQYTIILLKKLVSIAKEYKFNILIETISLYHSEKNVIGNIIEDITTIVKSIPYDNFGICWDIGHTKLNFSESRLKMKRYIPKDLINKVKFTHIHTINDGIDHMPIIVNTSFIKDEILYLKQNGYDGIYSLEINFELLKEQNINYNTVFNSLKYLNKIINNQKII